MPRTRAHAAAKPAEPEEQVELDEAEETMEEDVEYEEVEEEVDEEEEEEEEEEEVVEEPEEKDETAAANGTAADASATGGDDMQIDDERKKHSELLALPPHGSEVYIGGILDDVTEEDLKKFCEPAGEVTEIRVMKGKNSSQNKGYAFVTFRTKELAAKAVEDLNDTELKGKKVKCSTSQSKHRLFIGNVPRNWSEDELKKVVAEAGPGVTKLDLMKDPNNSSRNRGFAFVEYYNHACAEYSRKNMSTPKFKLDTNAPTVSWADPKSGEASKSQVKSVYVKNMPKDVTQDQLKKLFEHHGEITNVVLPPAKSGQEKQRFGFIHFADRTGAMKALESTEKYEIDGQVLDCSLAKPPADKKGETGSRNKKGAGPTNQPPRTGYGYGAQGFAQPMMYGRGQAPVGMAMVPMILPDGRLAYVMQQPGIPVNSPPPRGGSGRVGNSSGGRKSNDNNRGRRYQPY